MKTQIWSIQSLVGYLKNSLENDVVIQSILVKGEISNFTNHRSGHMYFSLKDKNASIPCVMFSSFARKLKIIPKEGMQVIVQAKVSLYEPRGSVQLYVHAMQSDGLGDLYIRFEQLKKQLYAEGLFDPAHKKALPENPMRIGVISAKTGAAIQDVLSIIARRWPIADVVLYPSLVQGENAAANIIENLLYADTQNHDVLLLVRGGGSMEDLWCFNDERLARVIYQLKTCIVSGVGHESDTTLVDYVSDFRAPTPSAAAELITPNYLDYIQIFETMKKRLVSAMDYKLQVAKKEVKYYQEKQIFCDENYLLNDVQMRLAMAILQLQKKENLAKEKLHTLHSYKQNLLFYLKQYEQNTNNKLQENENKLCTIFDMFLQNKKKEIHNNIALLDAYSPLKILQRGYAIALKDDKAIKTVEDVYEDDIITVKVNDGNLISKVLERIYNDGKNEF